jgi:hypothetical protein
MAETGLGNNAMADHLEEDRGALSDCLSGKPKARAPSAYLIFRMLSKLEGLDPRDLFFKDPEARFFQPGQPASDGSKIRLRKEPRPGSPQRGLSREPSPGKRRGPKAG